MVLILSILLQKETIKKIIHKKYTRNDGNKIWVYIPSIRMRRLLKRWIEKQHNNYAIK